MLSTLIRSAAHSVRRCFYTLGLVAIMFSPAVFAQDAPDVVLDRVARDMVASLNTHRDDIRRNPARLNELISDILLPHLDFVSASKWVLGKHWTEATRDQKKQFILEFRSLLVRFYSSALSEYLAENEVREEMIRIVPLRAPPENKSVTVRSEVRPPNGKPIPVLYHMHLRRGRWRIYDVSVEGVSMVSTYRTSFDSEIRQHGLDGLITSLAERNDDLLKKSRTQAN